jgi:hypothetical protein
MAQKTRIHLFMFLTLAMTVGLPLIPSARLVNAGGGVVLRPPFKNLSLNWQLWHNWTSRR